MRKIGVLFGTVVMVLVLLFATASVAYAADESNPLAVNDKALIEAGAKKVWTGFKYDYKYGYFSFSLKEDGTLEIFDCAPKAKGVVTVPSEIAGHKVNLGYADESLGCRIFSDCKNITKIIVSEGVEYIGTDAFARCESLEEIVLPEGLKAIWPYAFNDCPALQKVNIPDSVVELKFSLFSGTPIEADESNYRNGGFYWDNCLLAVSKDVKGAFVVEQGTRKIASSAFNWSEVNEIVLPDSLDTICSNIAIYGDGIKSINIPKNVKYIGEGFVGHKWVQTITVANENEYFCIVNNALLSKDKKRFIKCTLDASAEAVESGIYYIPNGVEEIDGDSFSGVYFDEVIIPSTTTNLKDAALRWARVDKITIPESVKKLGWHLFSGSDFKTIDLECDIKNIPYAAFDRCRYLKKISIPEGVEVIEGRAIENCDNLTEIILPSTLKKIVISNPVTNGTLFEECPKLETIKVASGNKYFKVVDGMLYNKELTMLYRCPTLYNQSSITLPETVQKIAPGAFYDCENVVSVKIPNGIEYISRQCFWNCSKLESVNIPNSVQVIEFAAFSGCPDLKTTVPKSVKRISSRAFGYKYIDYSYEKVKGYEIAGYTGTVAESYAEENGFTFVSEGAVSADYDNSITIDVSKQLKWLPCKSAMVDNVIYLLGDIYGDDVFSLSYYSRFAILDCFDNSISDFQKVGTGTGVDITLQDAWEFDSYTFVRFGDANGDGDVNQEDIKIAKKYVGKDVKKENYSMMAVDFDGDKKITSQDVQNLKDIVAGNVTEDEVCHVYKIKKITKATLTASGKSKRECLICGDIKTTTIYRPTSFKLSTNEYTYNQTERKPKATVKDGNGNKLIEGTDYTVKYESGRKLPGKYTVTITFKGNYSGTKKLAFTIAPRATSKITATQTITTLTLRWSKITGATLYRIYMYNPATESFEYFKSSSHTTLKIKELAAGSVYKFKVRAYTYDDGKIYGSYSSVFETATKTKIPLITDIYSKTTGKAVVRWSEVSGETGYQLYYSTSKDGEFIKVKSYDADKLAGAKTGLTSGETYYFKVRAYKKTDSGTVYSSWSSVKSVKIK